MGYGICRVQKVKAAAVGSMQYHNDRLPGEHSNPNIDHSKRGDNAEFIKHGSYRAEVNDRIERFRKSDRKVRKDAVVLVEGVMTASPEFFEGKSRDEVMAFFRDGFDFVKSEVGEGNMVHFTMHMDESTPHAHFGFVPLRDGKLSWKEFFPNKMALGEMQDRFYGRVGALYGLSRGEKRGDGEPAKRHKSVAEYKAENRRIQVELEEKTEQLESVKAKLVTTTNELKTAQDTAEKAKKQCDEYKAKVEDYAARFKRIKTELAQIAEACRDFEQGAQALESDLKLLGQRW